MKRILSFLLTAALCLTLTLAFTSCSNEPQYAVIEVEGYGTIVLELYPEYAPKTVKNFIKLADSGFYNGLIFHRIIEGFMIQGGDPKGNGSGGSGNKITGEFANNKYTKNTLDHVRGVISMARSGHPYEAYHDAGYYDIPYDERKPYYNSASSQFFIVHQDSPHLNGNYAAFGRVISGMSVVDAIASVRVDASNKPKTDVVIKSVYSVTREEALALVEQLGENN